MKDSKRSKCFNYQNFIGLIALATKSLIDKRLRATKALQITTEELIRLLNSTGELFQNYKTQRTKLTDYVRSLKYSCFEQKPTHFPDQLPERGPRKAFEELKDELRENSS